MYLSQVQLIHRFRCFGTPKTNKTSESNATPNIKRQWTANYITWTQSRGSQTAVSLWIRHMICYDINVTPPKALSPSRTQSSNSLKGAGPHVNGPIRREEKGPQVNQATPSIQTLEISERTRHTEVKSTRGVSTYRIQTHVPAVRPTPSPDPAPVLTRPVSRATHLPDPVPGVICPQSPGWTPPPRPCTQGGKTLG